jgi:uncharacterized protein
VARIGRPAWREPMTWLVAGLPLVVIAAAAVTIAIARRSPADASAGDTRRIAQIQIDDLGPDREAARRGLQAQLVVEPRTGRIDVSFAAGRVDDDALELLLLHPLDEQRDRRLTLHREGPSWRVSTPPWRTQDWELRLRPLRGDWRLAGRIAGNATRATLSPSVPP